VSRNHHHAIPFLERAVNRSFVSIEEVEVQQLPLPASLPYHVTSALALLLFGPSTTVELCWLRFGQRHSKKLYRLLSQPLFNTVIIPNQWSSIASHCVHLKLSYYNSYRTVYYRWIFASGANNAYLVSARTSYSSTGWGNRRVTNSSTPTYMLRRVDYRAALLLQPLGLTLRQCCLLWS